MRPNKIPTQPSVLLPPTVPVRWHDLGLTGYALPCSGRGCQICRVAKAQRTIEKRKAA